MPYSDISARARGSVRLQIATTSISGMRVQASYWNGAKYPAPIPTPRSFFRGPSPLGLPCTLALILSAADDNQPVLLGAARRHAERGFPAGFHRADGSELQGAAAARVE